MNRARTRLLVGISAVVLAGLWWRLRDEPPPPPPSPAEARPLPARRGLRQRSPPPTPEPDELVDSAAPPAEAEADAEAARRRLEGARPPQPDPLEGTEVVLDNGLTVYVVEAPEEPLIAAWLVIRSGGAHDPPGMEGAAHLLEHLSFRGTARLGSLDWAREGAVRAEMHALLDDAAGDRGYLAELRPWLAELEAEAQEWTSPGEAFEIYNQIGAQQINAYTFFDATTYQSLLPTGALPVWAAAEAERFAAPVLRSFEIERRVVMEEIEARRHSASRVSLPLRRRLLGAGHPYGHELGGDAETLTSISPSALRALHAQRYAPENAAVVLVGDLDTDEAIAVIERTFGAIPAREAQVPPIPVPDVARAAPVATHFRGRHLRLGALTPPPRDPRSDAHVLAAQILNRRLREEGLKSKLSVTPFAEVGVLAGTISCRLGESCADELPEQLRQAAGLPLRGAELRRAVRWQAFEEKDTMETPMTRARATVILFITGQRFRPLREAHLDYDRVSAAEVEAVLRRLAEPVLVDDLEKSRASSWERAPGSLPDGSGEDRPRSAFFRELLRLAAPVPATPLLVEGEDYHNVSGWFAEVFAAPNPVNDVYTLRLRYLRGWADDPLLCLAVEQWVDDAIQTLSPGPIAISSRCEEDGVFLHITGQDEDLGVTLERLTAQLRAPRLTEPDTSLIANILRAVQRNRTQALRAYARHGTQSAYLHAAPTAAELRSAAPDRLAEAIRALSALPVSAVYTGNHDPELVGLALSSLGGASHPTARAPARVSARLLVAEGSRSVTALRPIPPHTAARAPLYALYEAHMGGTSGALFRRMRAELGLTYTPRFRQDHEPDAPGEQLFFVSTSSAEATAEAAEALRPLLSPSRISEPEWEDLKARALAVQRQEAVPFRFRPAFMSNQLRLGYGYDPREEIAEAIERTSRREFEGFLAELADTPPTFIVTAPRGKPVGALPAALGAPEHVTDNDILRTE